MIRKIRIKIFLATTLQALLVLLSIDLIFASGTEKEARITAQPPELSIDEKEWIKSRPKIRVGVDSFWEPIEYKNRQGQFVGMAVDYLKTIETILGIEFEITTAASWAQLLEMAKKKEIDMLSCVVPTEKRREFLNFTDPYLFFPVVVFTREEISYVVDIKEFADKTIAVLKNHAIHHFIQKDYPDVRLLAVNTIPDGLKALQDGSAIAFIDNLLTTSHYINRLGYTNLKVAGETPFQYSLAMAARNDWPELTNIIQKALNSITPEARDGIHDKWVKLKWEHSFDYSILWKALLGTAIVFLFVWIATMRRHIRIHKRTEKALRKSEEKYRILVESAKDAIISVNANDIIIAWNQAAQDIFGYSPDEIIGQHLSLLVPEHEYDSHNEYLKQVFDKGMSLTNIVVERRRKDGSLVPIEFSTGMNKDDSGTVSSIIARDITQRKKAEQTLKMMMFAIDHASVEVYIIQPDQRIIYANNQAYRSLGYSKEDLLRCMVSDIYADLQEDSWNDFLQTLKIKKNMYFEGENRTRTKICYPVQVISNYVRFEHMEYIVFYRRDITERRAQEKKAEMQREQLLQADKMATLGTLVAGVAHEINNPNNFISLNIDSLQGFCRSITPILDEYYALNGDFRLEGIPYTQMKNRIPETINDIKDGSNRINQIVNNLRKFASRQTIEPEKDVDINQVVEESIKLLRVIISEATSKLKVYYGKGLPPVRGSFQQLEQVVINIILNGCHSLADKEKGIEIRTGFQAETRQLLIEIIDEGKGIPSSDLAHIFDPFFTTKREIGGTGLGLSISHGIIEDHKGTIHFESEESKGTHVTIRLPAQETV